MRILITGISGFAGRHLADLISVEKKAEVYGISHRVGDPRKRIYACDIRAGGKLETLVRRIRPDRIFHLAAQSSVPFSWERPKETFDQNLMGTLNLLEAARRFCPAARIQLAGSAQEYGVPPKDVQSIDESVPMNPSSPYAVSKVSQDLLACQYHAHFGMKIVRTRAFNHIGLRQTPDFVTSSFARQIALIEAGRQKPEIFVGNLDTVRDYTDVRDMVRGYWLALEKGKPGEVYNIASGKGHTAGEILDIYLGLSQSKIKIRPDKTRIRTDDLPRLVGDARKFSLKTGWRPRIPLRQSLSDILNYWRDEIKNKKVVYGKT